MRTKLISRKESEKKPKLMKTNTTITLNKNSQLLFIWSITILNIFIFLSKKVQYQFEWTLLYCTVNNIRKCLRLSDLSRDGMLHCRISCYCRSSGVCACVQVCVCVCVCVCTCGCVLGWQVWARRCVFIVATIPYSWFNAVNRSTFDKQQKYVKKKKTFWTWKFFLPEIFCIWFILLKKTALFYTIFIQYIPLCNCNGHLEFLL